MTMRAALTPMLWLLPLMGLYWVLMYALHGSTVLATSRSLTYGPGTFAALWAGTVGGFTRPASEPLASRLPGAREIRVGRVALLLVGITLWQAVIGKLTAGWLGTP